MAGHNRVSADRINLVFAPWGWDDTGLFEEAATAYLNWSGTAQLWDEVGMPVAPDSTSATVSFADLGVFGMEPFRSRRDLFNVWTTRLSPPAPYDWLESQTTPNWAPDQVVVVLALRDGAGEVKSSVAGDGSMFDDPARLERFTDQPFANAVVAVEPGSFVLANRVVAHELGHALFSLADEYVGRETGFDGDARNAFWPSCADDQQRAEAWWSSSIGEYDDQLDYWAEEVTSAGFGPTRAELVRMRDENRTAYVAEGCFGVPGSVRSTADSIMGFNFPAFGVTNRRWAEQVLDLWTGE
ncbi:hypothetical protein OVN18_02170 [Microcella daejeonensis]|uniref:Uncharacterized protein n=1 Tax=Microcella daejeonensis TaxID=2994971 RepID=A0A9E8MLJ6_9MICO|nr:hypothetical protein [Microcella daejeonensis]WAB81850.1 hypothetical protein OVN18_02170 [Microcella daejeonensis]WAB84008.1 hypothetical protein OVN20_13430 [Microcella daejeonensis]